MDADYADDLVQQANILAQAKILQHNQEQVARGIGLYINTNKTEFMSFKPDIAISILNEKPLKLEHFTYLGGNIASTESDVNIYK